MENYIFWSEMESRFGEPGGTPPPRIVRSAPPGSRPTYRLDHLYTVFPRIIAIISFFASKGGDYSREGDYFKYSRLPITRTLANSNLALTRTKIDFPCRFPSYIHCNFTLGNSNPRCFGLRFRNYRLHRWLIERIHVACLCFDLAILYYNY